MPEEPSDNRPAVFLMTNTFETGGSERQFVTLARALRREAFRVELGCLGRLGVFNNGLGDVPEFPPGGKLYGWQSLRARLALGRRLRSRRIAVAHSFDFYSNLMMIPAAKFAGVPVVIGSQRQLGDLLSKGQVTAQNAAFCLADCVVCNSRAAADRLTRAGLPDHKIKVIPNALPQEAFAETAPALPRSESVLRVGMIARMNNPVKNYPVLLDAAARLAAKYSNVEFLLAGDGPLRPELESMAKSLGIERQVRFLGDRSDIPAVLASMDISVLTSHSESLSNAILESMAAGLPVVATRVGGNPDLVHEGETGFLIPPGDAASLAEAIERLLAAPELRREFGRKAKAFALENFSLTRVRDQYERLYTALLARKDRLTTPPARH